MTIDGDVAFSNYPLSPARGDETFSAEALGELVSGEGRWQMGDGLHFRDSAGRPVLSIQFPIGDGGIEVGYIIFEKVADDWQPYAQYGDVDARKRLSFVSSDCIADR